MSIKMMKLYCFLLGCLLVINDEALSMYGRSGGAGSSHPLADTEWKEPLRRGSFMSSLFRLSESPQTVASRATVKEFMNEARAMIPMLEHETGKRYEVMTPYDIIKGKDMIGFEYKNWDEIFTVHLCFPRSLADKDLDEASRLRQVLSDIKNVVTFYRELYGEDIPAELMLYQYATAAAGAKFVDPYCFRALQEGFASMVPKILLEYIYVGCDVSYLSENLVSCGKGIKWQNEGKDPKEQDPYSEIFLKPEEYYNNILNLSIDYVLGLQFHGIEVHVVWWDFVSPYETRRVALIEELPKLPDAVVRASSKFEISEQRQRNYIKKARDYAKGYAKKSYQRTNIIPYKYDILTILDYEEAKLRYSDPGEVIFNLPTSLSQEQFSQSESLYREACEAYQHPDPLVRVYAHSCLIRAVRLVLPEAFDLLKVLLGEDGFVAHYNHGSPESRISPRPVSDTIEHVQELQRRLHSKGKTLAVTPDAGRGTIRSGLSWSSAASAFRPETPKGALPSETRLSRQQSVSDGWPSPALTGLSGSPSGSREYSGNGEGREAKAPLLAPAPFVAGAISGVLPPPSLVRQVATVSLLH